MSFPFADLAARGDLNLCGLSVLCGESRKSFTTEGTESTEEMGSERGDTFQKFQNAPKDDRARSKGLPDTEDGCVIMKIRFHRLG